MNFAKIFGWIFLLILIGGTIFVGTNFQQIQDYFRAKNFKPSAKILQITEKIKPTDRAKQIFFATNPQVLSAEDFNKNCSRASEKTTILGCYKADEIFVFNVEDQDLTGVEEVTAAHELLHAVWFRLSREEKSKLSEELRAEYERLKTPELEATMAEYAKTQPGEHENELHSILGTEFSNLSSSLEEHYANFFKDRKEIAAMASNYKSKFKSLEHDAETLNEQLKALKTEIEAEVGDYKTKAELLNSRIDTFNSRAESGYYSSQNAFLADRNSIISQQKYLESYRAQINSKVEDFNSKTQELSKISSQIQRLYDSLNSKIEKVEQTTSL